MAVFIAISGCYAGDSEKLEKIPLDSIYSTFSQKGLKNITDRENMYYEELMTKSKHGASNFFLVRGDDFSKAIEATHRVAVAGSIVDRITLEEQPQGQVWMVVYWGIAGSSPPCWTIHSVERSEKTIRLRYRHHEDGGETKDLHRYYAWVPPGELKAGKYNLEMWDEDNSERMLTRLCWIIPKRK